MKGYIDLHSHWIAGIDDGCRSDEEGLALLEALFSAGFSRVYATPHMRPGMFENDKIALQEAYTRMLPKLEGRQVPKVSLASEHFFDDVVFARLKRGEGLAYTPEKAALGQNKRSILVEFSTQMLPAQMPARIVELGRAGLRLVIAHPERYRPVWNDDRCLDPLLDLGVYLLLDICSLVGKYGKASQDAAEKLLEDGAYEAACSDAHRPEDVETVVKAIERAKQLQGVEETERLLRNGPRTILGEAP